MRRRTRAAISEIFSALLLSAATIAVGGLVTVSISSQFASSQSGFGQSFQQQRASAGKLISLVQVSLSSGNLIVEVYNYGFTNYAPTIVFVNNNQVMFSLRNTDGTVASTIAPGMFVNVQITGTYTTPTGWTLFLADSVGDVIQLAT